MSADAERANLDDQLFEKELLARQMRDLGARLADTVPDDPRLASGIPPQMRLEEEAFVQLTGLTRPSSQEASEDHTADPGLAPQPPEAPSEISFGEPGVLDVDEGDAPASAEKARPSESVAALRALVADLERDADKAAAAETDAEPEAHEASPKAPPPSAPPYRPGANLEELELLIQALEDQPRDDGRGSDDEQTSDAES